MSRKFIELPFRNKQKINLKTLIIFSSLCTAIFVISGVTIHVNDGFHKRYPLEYQKYQQMDQLGTKARNYNCHLKVAETRLTACSFGVENVVPTYALIGDSHAGALHEALADLFITANKSFVLYANL